MADTVCLKCNVGWVLFPYDQYCGYCGCKVFNFSVKWEEDPLIYRGDGTDPRKQTILVENTGARSITFQPIETKQEKAIELPDRYKKPFKIKAGQSHSVVIQINPADLTQHPEVITVRTQDVLSNLKSEKSLELQSLPRPDFILTPNHIDLRYPKSKITETVDFKVEFLQNQFDIEDIEFSEEWINNIDFSKAPKSIGLKINCSKLKDGLNSETLRFKLRGPSRLIEKPIQISAKVSPEPPKLFVPDVNLAVIQDREKSYTLKLENKGELPLTIQNIEIWDSSSLVQLSDLDFPIHIEGGEHQNVELLVSALGIEPATYPIDFIISSNCDTAPEYQHILNLTVNRREEYPYYLAIDFGTTNSCCAYIDMDYAWKLLPLDSKANPPDIMPSSIIYRSQPKEGNKYDVGYDAETDRTSSNDGPYYISSVKRWLGYRWHRQFPNNQELQPSDVVSHILKHIVNEAEDYLEQQNIPSKVTKCIITHPTKFTRQQQDDLRQAFENTDISDLILIDEASAASMGILFERYENLQEDYKLLVYDFGGGTIDIVLSQVTIDGDNITIEPLARGGNPIYGGDDVTQVIVDFVLKEYRKRIEKEHSNLNFCIPYFEPKRILQPSRNPKIDDATRRNAASLYQRAEEMKKELNTQSETEFFASLEVVVGNDVRTLEELIQDTSSVKLSVQLFQSFIEPALKKTFADIDAMIAENDKQLPDTIVLAGQSSKMQLVKNMMATHFQEKHQTDIEIHLDEHPKTCVVMGAAQYGLTRTLSPEEGSGIQIANLANKTLSRLGIVRIAGGIKPVFGEIIPKGKLIPNESVNTTNFRLDARRPYVDVREHFGLDNDLKNASRIASYTLNLPEDIPKQALKEARLKMAVKDNGEIELTAVVGDKGYTSTVEKKEPEFVDEIHRSELSIETVNVQKQTLSIYQQKAEQVIHDAQERMANLSRAYRDGEPIDFAETINPTAHQKVILLLNWLARDLEEWTGELERSYLENPRFTPDLIYAAQAIKDKLKNIRGNGPPSPKSLNLETDISTDDELKHIQNQCDVHVAGFRRMLSSYELRCEADETVYHQFIQQIIRDRLFSGVAKCIPIDRLPEQVNKFLKYVDWEVVSIEVGKTKADARLHEIQDSRLTDTESRHRSRGCFTRIETEN